MGTFLRVVAFLRAGAFLAVVVFLRVVVRARVLLLLLRLLPMLARLLDRPLRGARIWVAPPARRLPRLSVK